MTAQAEAPQPIHFRPRRLGHANLWVSNTDKVTEFYNQVVGLKIEATEPGIVGSFLGNGNTHHDIGMVEITHGEDRVGRDGQILIPKDISGRTGLFHLGWEMESEAELVSAIERVKAAGQGYMMIVDHQISHSIYLPDPDGNLIEFYADSLKDWKSIFHGEMELITGNWSPGEETPTKDARYSPNPTLYGVTEAPVHPLRITHVAFVVADVARSCEFYTEVAGLHPIYTAPDVSYACLQGSTGRYNLALFQAGEDLEVGTHHLGFEAANDAAVDEAARVLRDRGIAIVHEIDNDSKRSVFFSDPDGMGIEFASDRAPNFAAIAGAPRAERPFLG